MGLFFFLEGACGPSITQNRACDTSRSKGTGIAPFDWGIVGWHPSGRDQAAWGRRYGTGAVLHRSLDKGRGSCCPLRSST